MTISIPIARLKAARPAPRHGPLVRVVPEPKSFVLAVKWEECAAQPTALPIHCKPAPNQPPRLVEKILRLTLPLELRLDPAL